jgi:hypothetical protein
MKTVMENVVKASLAMVLGWTAAVWMLFTLISLLALIA